MDGQVVLVTGGSGGIGSAICRRFARAGAKLVVTCHSNEQRAHDLVKELGGDSHLAMRASVTDRDAVCALADKVAARYGRLDVLVNNAGITRAVVHDDLDMLDDETIDAIFQTNWRGAFAMVRAFKSLLAADGGGLVVNMSSIGGTTAVGSNVAYCASKAALDSMTKSLARALAPAIRMVSVAPGWVLGEYASRADPTYLQLQTDLTPLGRLADATDVANAVFAVATELTFTTGVVIPVDGGRPLT